MSKFYVIFFLLLVLSLCSSYFKVNKHSYLHTKKVDAKDFIAIDTTPIIWSKTRKLIWKDFQGKPDSLSEFKAITSSRIESKSIVFKDEIIEYDFVCFFVKSKSWTKSNTNTLLKHEQLHFDIAELATRKLRKKFLEYKYVSKESIKQIVNQYFDEAVLDRRKTNSLYDKETNHGTIETKQKEWETKIANELKKFDAFSNTRVVIKRVKNK